MPSSWPSTTKPSPSLLALEDVAAPPRPACDRVAVRRRARWLGEQALDRSEHDRLRSTRVVRRARRACASRTQRDDRSVFVGHAERPQGPHHARGMRPGLPRASRSTSARATSSSPSSWRSARTTRSRRSSIPTGPTASRSRCSSRARSCSTSPPRPAASCPTTCAAATQTLEWLMFQMGGVGPMLGQAHHFRLYAPEKIPYAIDRYSNEAKRLYGVMDKRLQTQPVHRRRRVHDRRHRDLPVAALVEEPGHRLGRLPAPEGLVRRASPRGRRCSAASRCWRRCASRCAATRSARCCSARRSTSAADRGAATPASWTASSTRSIR